VVPPTQPVSKEAAQYQDTPKGILTCAVCTFFRAPGSCKVVTGIVSPHGWCPFFDMPD
jgi:hypothetical protein